MSKSKESLKDLENDYDEVILGAASGGAAGATPAPVPTEFDAEGKAVMIDPPDLFNPNKSRHR